MGYHYCRASHPLTPLALTPLNRILSAKDQKRTGAYILGVVVKLDGSRKPEQSLEGLLKLVDADMERVNQMIIDKMQSKVDMIPKLAGHLIHSGGKRLRPMMTIASAKLCGYEEGNQIDMAVAVEFLHTATLLHDDVVDESDLRRGRKTARLLWGNQASVLVGDYLLGQSIKMMVDVGSLNALGIFSAAAATIAKGEVMQLLASQNTATTEDEYLAVINAKTAALFAAAAELGGAICDRPETERAALRSYGKNLGIAFQLVDDALDYSGDPDKLGKSVGDDFREGKMTLPVVLSYRRGDDEERKFWHKALEEGNVSDEDLKRAVELILSHDAIKDTGDRAKHYGSIARDALAIFPESDEKSALLGAIDFCVERVY